MILLRPRSTLFPYTTLFRSDADVVVARFLKELKTDYLDLLLLHCVTDADWPDQLRQQMDILSKLKKDGKIRALGVSDRKSTRLNSSHMSISYAVFCLKKKKN